MTGAAVHLEGARQLARALRATDKGLAREVTAGLREGGKIVAEEARSLIREQGLVASGAALKSVKVSVRSFEVFVRETASRDGFPYPRLRRFKGLVLEPARDRKIDAVGEQVEKTLDRLLEGQGLL